MGWKIVLGGFFKTRKMWHVSHSMSWNSATYQTVCLWRKAEQGLGDISLCHRGIEPVFQHPPKMHTLEERESTPLSKWEG